MFGIDFLCFGCGNYRYETFVVLTYFELYSAIDQCKQSVVLAHTCVLAGMELCSTLAHDDVTGLAGFSSIHLNAQSLAMRFTAVLRTTYAFLMCHFFFVFWG